MAALEIVKTVIECAVDVHNAVQQVKGFKSRSRILGKRVEVVIEPVKELEEKLKPKAEDKSAREAEEVMRLESPADYQQLSYIRPLRGLALCVEEVKQFLEVLSTMNTLEKFARKGNITAQFDGFDDQLTTLQQSLMLTLQVVFNKEMNDKFRSMMFDLETMNKENQEALVPDQRDWEDSIKQIYATVKENNALLKQQKSEVCNQVFSFRGFAVLDMIEEGTFGPIHKAKHNMEDKLLVIKKYTDSSDPSVEVLKKQLRVWRELATSSFIVQPYGYTMDDEGHMCFVLEYMDFGTLRKVLTDKEHELPWKRQLSLARDCARGLYAIHNGVEGKTMLHRAVTSTRFLVNKHYVAKIADNGFVTSQSKVLKSKSRTKGDLEKDEMKYHVPEDTESQFKATLKSEIYKLGVIFYEIASRKEPFQSMDMDGEGLGVVYKFIMDGKMEEPPADTPAAFRELMNSCRATKPSDRPSTADVVSSLDKILEEI